MRKKIPGPVWVNIEQVYEIFPSRIAQRFDGQLVYYSLQGVAKKAGRFVGRYKKNLKGQPE